VPSSTARSFVRSTPTGAVIGAVVAALTLAQFPGGDLTGRDRELVARITRAGVQRSETENSAAVSDHADVHEPGTPARVSTRRVATCERSDGIPQPGEAVQAVASAVGPGCAIVGPSHVAVEMDALAEAATLPWPPSRARSGRAPPPA
jgi:hypothetical protein